MKTFCFLVFLFVTCWADEENRHFDIIIETAPSSSASSTHTGLSAPVAAPSVDLGPQVSHVVDSVSIPAFVSPVAAQRPISVVPVAMVDGPAMNPVPAIMPNIVNTQFAPFGGFAQQVPIRVSHGFPAGMRPQFAQQFTQPQFAQPHFAHQQFAQQQFMRPRFVQVAPVMQQRRTFVPRGRQHFGVIGAPRFSHGPGIIGGPMKPIFQAMDTKRFNVLPMVRPVVQPRPVMHVPTAGHFVSPVAAVPQVLPISQPIVKTVMPAPMPAVMPVAMPRQLAPMSSGIIATAPITTVLSKAATKYRRRRSVADYILYSDFNMNED